MTINATRRRGRPPLTEAQKAEARARRESVKTIKFAVGDEPNRRKLKIL